MTLNHSSPVALLTTGDELCHGEILNSNSQYMANALISQGIPVGMHLTVRDDFADIQTAIHFLLQQHQAVIMTGGLGPTSDDLTRQALAAAFNRQLIFDEAVWQAIVARLHRFGYEIVPENNRQQAFFPEGAEIFPNPNGTAAGCMLQENNQWICMLPGPPNECLPMFETHVFPLFKKQGFQEEGHRKKWFLFGVSEGFIAEKLDKIAEPFHCRTGYRFWYPYVEFKLYSQDKKEFDTVINLIQAVIQEYLIEDGRDIASEIVKQKLINSDYVFDICDTATGGYLENTLKMPANYARLNFLSELKNNPNKIQIKIKGLADFWEQKKGKTQTELEIYFLYQGNEFIHQTAIPLRGEQVKRYATEYISKKIIEFLFVYCSV